MQGWISFKVCIDFEEICFADVIFFMVLLLLCSRISETIHIFADIITHKNPDLLQQYFMMENRLFKKKILHILVKCFKMYIS